MTLQAFKYEAEWSHYRRVGQVIILRHCEMMKLTPDYNAYMDAKVARLAQEDAVDEKSGGAVSGGGQEEDDEERPFVVFRQPAKKPRKPTETATTKRVTKKAPLKQMESVASSSTVTNVSQETLELANAEQNP